MYDFIGDTHDQREELEQLLTKVDYKIINVVYEQRKESYFSLETLSSNNL